MLYEIGLTLLPYVGPITAKTLVSYCGSAEAVFKASKKELLKIPGIGPAVAESVRSQTALSVAENELVFIEKHAVEAVFYTDPRFPNRLKQCADSPAILYFKGSSAQLLDSERIVAIVGTRQPSDYGRAVCEELIEGLKVYNPLIVSGLAFGIDVTAHRKAVQIDVPNIGVMGNGLSSIYPAVHRSIAVKMVENGGLLTEFISSTKPDRENFPMRNRIIAGLCDVLVVVQTAASGGSIISANLAIQYGREVCAVPGNIKDPKSTGCNQLIKIGSAQLIETAEDIAEAMRWPEPGKPQVVQKQLFVDYSPQEKKVYDLILAQPEIPIDLLSSQAQLTPGELASIVLNLEFKGIIRTLPGKRYILS
jgi:DNA processing protein